MTGTALQAYTLIHVAISLAAIVVGLIVAGDLVSGNQPPARRVAFFLGATALTSLTGYFFPFEGFKPSYVVGALTLIVVGIAYAARNGRSKTFAISALVALYFNVFVLVFQSFLKVPALHALAPTQSEPPFAIAQLAVLALFMVAGVLAVKRLPR